MSETEVARTAAWGSNILHAFFSKENLATALSITAAGGFVVSTIINGLVFRDWGLNFLQVASVSDVLMSGLHTSFIFWLDLVVFFLLLAFVLNTWINPPRYEDDEEEDDAPGTPGPVWWQGVKKTPAFAIIKTGYKGVLTVLGAIVVISLLLLFFYYLLETPALELDRGYIVAPWAQHSLVLFFGFLVCTVAVFMCFTVVSSAYEWFKTPGNKGFKVLAFLPVYVLAFLLSLRRHVCLGGRRLCRSIRENHPAALRD